jgi:predicted SprT family Zn-dependent metalloprotease
MKLEEAEAIWEELAERYWFKLDGWKLAFDNAKRRCGSTVYPTKTITLSRHFVRLNGEADVRETLLHEIAHAVAGPAAGHGRVWQGIARQLGAKPERCATGVEMPKGNVVGTCAPDCGTEHFRHRMPPKRLLNAYQCMDCLSKVTWRIVK